MPKFREAREKQRGNEGVRAIKVADQLEIRQLLDVNG